MTTRVCDFCGNQLDDAGPRPSYYLELKSCRMPNKAGFCYAVYVKDPLDRTMHFCGFECIARWAAVSGVSR